MSSIPQRTRPPYCGEHLLRSGREFELKVYGVAAMQSLRIENAFPLYGPDIDEGRNPFHVGLGRWIRFDKRDFIGREALLRARYRGLDQHWVGLILVGETPAAAGDAVYAVADVATSREIVETGPETGAYEDELIPAEGQIGRVTSSATGPSVGKVLAMAYVDTGHSWPGNTLIVETGGRPVPPRVAQTPYFDPENARLRSEPPDDRHPAHPPPAVRRTNARAGVPVGQSADGST